MVLASMPGKRIYEPFNPRRSIRESAEEEYGHHFPEWEKGRPKHEWLKSVHGVVIKTVTTHHRERELQYLTDWADHLILLTRPIEESIISYHLQRDAQGRSYREWNKGNPATVPLHSVRVPDKIITRFLRANDRLKKFRHRNSTIIQFKQIPDLKALQRFIPNARQPHTRPSPFNPMDYIHPDSLAKIRSLTSR